MERRSVQGETASAVGIAVNLILAAVKAAAGLAAGSAALLADAFHSGADGVASGAILAGFRISRRPADACHPYGHGKAESIAGKVVAVLLILAGLNIGLWALRRALGPPAVPPGGLALAAAALSIAVKEGMFRYQAAVARRIDSDALLASAWEQRSDSLSSVAALAGVAGARAGLPFLDPLAGAVVAAMVIQLGYRLFRRFADELMDKFDHPELINAIAGAVEAVPGAKRVHSIRARHVGHEVLVDLKIAVDPALSVAAGHDIAHRARQAVLDQVERVADVMVHVDPAGERTPRNG